MDTVTLRTSRFSAFRDWLTFFLLVVGSFVAYRTYEASQAQRKLENSLKLIEGFHRAVSEKDLSRWATIYHGTTVDLLKGVRPTGFNQGDAKNRRRYSFNDLFAEGPPDEGAIERMATQFEIISYQIVQGAADPQIVYAELGQYIVTVYDWLGTIPPIEGKAFLLLYYPYFSRMVDRYGAAAEKWPRRKYATIDG